MPITVKGKDVVGGDGTLTGFIYKNLRFVLSQTDGEEYAPTLSPTWDKAWALAALHVPEIPFGMGHGNACLFHYLRKEESLSEMRLAPVSRLVQLLRNP